MYHGTITNVEFLVGTAVTGSGDGFGIIITNGNGDLYSITTNATDFVFSKTISGTKTIVWRK